jgi:hypothetical protein
LRSSLAELSKTMEQFHSASYYEFYTWWK